MVTAALWGRLTSIGSNLDQSGEPPFIDYLLMAELGFARDLGFPTGPLLQEFSQFLTGQIAADGNGYDARYLAAYRLSSANSGGTAYTTWAQVGEDFSSKVDTAHTLGVFDGSYGEAYAAIGAATAGSYLTGYSNGSSAWNWLKTQVLDNSHIHYGIGHDGWRVLPRSSTPPTPPAPSNL